MCCLNMLNEKTDEIGLARGDGTDKAVEVAPGNVLALH